MGGVLIGTLLFPKVLIGMYLFLPLQQDIPAEDKLESACEMITITGKALSQSKEKKTKEALDGYMARLQRLSDTKDLPSRIRFIVSGRHHAL
jgi:hypothetical protein